MINNIMNVVRNASAQIKTRVETTDSAGGISENWVVKDTITGNLQPVSAKQRFIRGEDATVYTHVFYTADTSDYFFENNLLVIDRDSYRITCINNYIPPIQLNINLSYTRIELIRVVGSDNDAQ